MAHRRLHTLAQTETRVRGFSENARLVANNISALRLATSALADADTITVDGIRALHQALLPNSRHHGVRDVQNWIR